MTLSRFRLPALLLTALFTLSGLSGCGGGDSNMPPQTPEQLAIAADNLAKGKAFMEANKEKEGVITLESGVQYKILSNGDDEARSPKLADSVKVHYRSFRIDGSELFDTHKEAAPQTVEVKRAILGWRKVLPMMRVGSKWMVYIPAYMAYSSKGFKDSIGPNETLIYELELLEIVW